MLFNYNRFSSFVFITSKAIRYLQKNRMDVKICIYDQEFVFHAGVGDETKDELAIILLIPEGSLPVK